MEKKPTKRQQQHMETLDAIRAAVDKLVTEIGFENMRIQDICKEVGISTGAFYHYFSSKSDVFRDRFSRRNGVYRNLYEERYAHLPPMEALKLFMEGLLQYTYTRVPNVLKNYSKALIDEYMSWYADDGDAVLEVIEKLVQRGQDAGEFKHVYAPTEAAIVLNDYYRGIMVSESICHWTEEEYNTRCKILCMLLDALKV